MGRAQGVTRALEQSVRAVDVVQQPDLTDRFLDLADLAQTDPGVGQRECPGIRDRRPGSRTTADGAVPRARTMGKLCASAGLSQLSAVTTANGPPARNVRRCTSSFSSSRGAESTAARRDSPRSVKPRSARVAPRNMWRKTRSEA
jgi:hypothetical protein